MRIVAGDLAHPGERPVFVRRFRDVGDARVFGRVGIAVVADTHDAAVVEQLADRREEQGAPAAAPCRSR